MSPKPVIPREQADRDVDDAVTYYVKEHAQQAALDLVDALQDAYAHVGRRPGMGSPLYSHELDIPGLRTWPLARFPYLVFYVEREDHVDVWRVLHPRRDIQP
ncbi:type II toxin-antitoxin system RelE/ParE family toxin [Phytoactinopolyspora endophytica]|uniref:type II toxin-antitoxin system RelE/ParE family toxin n=1 Tax=Phytoactinopolyspora endophytica TaxID=1642495 RepID=UPI00101CC618|nr:type II toxin-antitoxin system RelE/ParE family toxin [Phytoactinopolyspora endophytica]